MGIGIPGGGGFRRGTVAGARQRINSGPLPRFSNIDRQQGLSILANGISQVCQGAVLGVYFNRQSAYMTIRTVSAPSAYGNIFVQYTESFGIVATANRLNLDHITFNRGISQADVLHILNAIPQAQNSQDLRRLDAYGAGTVAFADQAQTAAPTANPIFARIAAETDSGQLERLGSDALGRGKTDIFIATLRRRVELNPSDHRLQRTLATNLLQQPAISEEDASQIRSLLLNIAAIADSQSWLAGKYEEIRNVKAVPAAIKTLLEELTRDTRANKPKEPVTHDFVGRSVRLDGEGAVPRHLLNLDLRGPRRRGR